jgi:hypothetical protein
MDAKMLQEMTRILTEFAATKSSAQTLDVQGRPRRDPTSAGA